jgi:hypothetical protein
VILLLISNICFAQTDTIFKQFTDKNFALQYPSNWDVNTTGKMGTALLVLSPLENEADNFKENVNVLIQEQQGITNTLENYRKVTELQFADKANNCNVLESEIFTNNHSRFYKALYTMKYGETMLKISAVCFIKNNKAYLATFTTTVDTYLQYKPIGDKILATFQVVK